MLCIAKHFFLRWVVRKIDKQYMPHHTILEILAAPTVPGEQPSICLFLTKLSEALDNVEYLNLWSVREEVEACDIKVELKAYRQYDTRRSASVYVLKYQGIPVLVASWAGREEQDEQQQFILNGELLWKLIDHLTMLATKATRHTWNIVPLNTHVLMPQWGERPASLGNYERE